MRVLRLIVRVDGNWGGGGYGDREDGRGGQWLLGSCHRRGCPALLDFLDGSAWADGVRRPVGVGTVWPAVAPRGILGAAGPVGDLGGVLFRKISSLSAQWP